MDRRRLDQAIMEIRAYTQRHPELRKAHHFLFDVPLDRTAGPPEFVILGINPGETERDWEAHPGPTEETWLFDFHEASKLGRSPGSSRWRERAASICGSRAATLGQFFFWSSNNSEQFVQRFGTFGSSRHRDFCFQNVGLLIDHYKPKAVIVCGLHLEKIVAQHYSLKLIGREMDGPHRLVVHYRDVKRPWFFTKHWTAGHGFSNAQLETIAKYVQSHCTETSDQLG